MSSPVADDATKTSAVDVRPDSSYNSRPQSAELSTSFVGEPGSTPSPTSRQTGSRSRDGGGHRSRLVAPRTCVQRQQPRDPATADGTHVNAMPN